ncbi:putative vacuolar protein-sorting-associated protein [Trichodelitschia bisporula]|uniref:Vacuolar protein-sorting-associated protein 25 n=1 Tax=Trichodelitschia bisporula TaxID=703511 RepID=A0A6G1HZB9_9PEZI|nr:putative vacuolar protein-sorting-associated protein [Trichodelitschia bisporula]
MPPDPYPSGTDAPSTDFRFIAHYNFPPFFTLQPNPLTRSSQLETWSTHILSYCRHHRIFTLTLIDALSTPLFHNTILKKKLSLNDARTVLNWMASKEGGERIEWIGGKGGKESKCWVFWRRPEEWADAVGSWVEATGQKGVVFTLYELGQGEATRSQEFYGIDRELLHRSLQILVKKGKAQIFGQEDQLGIKFF